VVGSSNLSGRASFAEGASAPFLLLLDNAVLAVQEDSPRSLVEVGRVVACFLPALRERIADCRRGIAQPGRAPALGAGCREFESLYPDHFDRREGNVRINTDMGALDL
jgi:hypothetical protein